MRFCEKLMKFLLSSLFRIENGEKKVSNPINKVQVNFDKLSLLSGNSKVLRIFFLRFKIPKHNSIKKKIIKMF